MNPASLANLNKAKPGEVRNPAGKGGFKSVKTLVQDALLNEVDGKNHAVRILEKQIQLAEHGEISSAEFLFAYGFGRPAQAIDMNVSDRREQIKALFPSIEELEAMDDGKPKL